MIVLTHIAGKGAVAGPTPSSHEATVGPAARAAAP
jgi:hypothetical protein